MSAEKAGEFAQAAHENQKRATGELYFTHCEEVVRILQNEWGINDETILSAGYLHDTVEDNPNITLNQLSLEFGPDVAQLVDGVSKYRSEPKNSDRETIRKVLITSYLDPRVAVIKLADRLHNMRTLEHLPPEKQNAKALETLHVYAPLAESLGIWKVKTELEDLALPFLPKELPFTYQEIYDQIQLDPRLSKNFIAYWESSIKRLLEEVQIQGEVFAQQSGYYTLAKKRAKAALEGKSSPVSFHSINDVISIRITLENLNACYITLGAIHNRYKNLTDSQRLDEFIVDPRENGYSALQTTLQTPHGALEIAITTKEMEDFNTWGVISLIRNHSASEILEQYTLKPIFTPQHKVIFLPKNATGIDFAYAISPELGVGAISLEIDGQPAPLSTNLPNASVVKIITNGPQNNPNSEFLDYCLPKTQKIIRGQLERQERFNLASSGQKKLTQALAEQKIGILSILHLPTNNSYRLLQNFGCNSVEELYFKIGGNYLPTDEIISWLNEENLNKNSLGLTTIEVSGPDQPRLLESLSTWVGEHHGNITKVNLECNEGQFNLRLVINGFSASAEQAILQKIKSDSRFINSLVV